MKKSDLINKYLDIVTRKGISSSSKKSLKFYLDYLFQNIPFVGKSMLDIGGGCGLYSFYAACKGAKHVICLEPELAGSTKGTFDKFRKLSASLSLSNVTFQPIRFQDFDSGNQIFDTILLHNSINHLDEEACIKLQYDDAARNRYKFTFQKLSEISAPGAKLIIADCSRYNFFASLGIKNPFAPIIEWHKHQSPEFWSSMLLNYGFINPKVRWTSFNNLRKAGRLLFGNRFTSYFLTSHFVLVMDRNVSKKSNSEIKIHVQ